MMLQLLLDLLSQLLFGADVLGQDSCSSRASCCPCLLLKERDLVPFQSEIVPETYKTAKSREVRDPENLKVTELRQMEKIQYLHKEDSQRRRVT